MHDKQRSVDIDAYQGESRFVKDNIFLGKFTIKVPPREAGQESIDIRFTYDINGIVEVEATVNSTGEKASIIIEENPGALSKDEIEKRFKQLAKLKIHPRDQSRNKVVINRASRIYEELLGEPREYIGDQISQFTAVLERQDSREIEIACQNFMELLDDIENDPFT
jgi:molecular chaperone HscC